MDQILTHHRRRCGVKLQTGNCGASDQTGDKANKTLIWEAINLKNKTRPLNNHSAVCEQDEWWMMDVLKQHGHSVTTSCYVSPLSSESGAKVTASTANYCCFVICYASMATYIHKQLERSVSWTSTKESFTHLYLSVQLNTWSRTDWC